MTNIRNFLEYLDSLFSQEIPSNIANTRIVIEDQRRLLRKLKIVQQQMNPQAKSELNITTLHLPERYKLTRYYETLPTDMDEKEKALAIRLKLEEIRTNPDKLNPITECPPLNPSMAFNWLNYCIVTRVKCSGRLSRLEIYTCIEILYSIWDSGDGHYDDIVSNLVTEYNQFFPTEREVYTTIQDLVDKKIVECRILFREFGTERLLKPNILLRLSKDIERVAMVTLQYQDMIAGNPPRNDKYL